MRQLTSIMTSITLMAGLNCLVSSRNDFRALLRVLFIIYLEMDSDESRRVLIKHGISSAVSEPEKVLVTSIGLAKNNLALCRPQPLASQYRYRCGTLPVRSQISSPRRSLEVWRPPSILRNSLRPHQDYTRETAIQIAVSPLCAELVYANRFLCQKNLYRSRSSIPQSALSQ